MGNDESSSRIPAVQSALPGAAASPVGPGPAARRWDIAASIVVALISGALLLLAGAFVLVIVTLGSEGASADSPTADFNTLCIVTWVVAAAIFVVGCVFSLRAASGDRRSIGITLLSSAAMLVVGIGGYVVASLAW